MKDIDFYAPEEDERFSQLVIKFNNLEDDQEEKETLRTYIRDRTQILFYQIPIRYLFMSEDEASELYLFFREQVDKVIAAYKISLCTYNKYIAQVCKYRARNLSYLKKKKRMLETSIYFAESELYNEEDVDFSEPDIHYGCPHPEVGNMDLKELFSFIIKTHDEDEICFDKKEEALNQYLKKPKGRQYMLIYLLTLPQIESPEWIDNIAKVFQLDSLVIHRFYELRFDLLNDTNERWEDAMRISNKHYNNLLSIRQQLEFEWDEEKRDELLQSYERTKTYHTKSLENAKKKKRGMTIREISEELDIKQSLASYAVMQMKKVLQQISV